MNPGANSLVGDMLKRRLEQDVEANAVAAKRREIDDRNESFCRLVLAQAKQTIQAPIAQMVTEFNREYTGNKAVVSNENTNQTITQRVGFPNGRSVFIEFHVILEQNFVREVEFEDFGRRCRRKVIQLPLLQVQGWGSVRGSDRRGFNIILLERNDEVYGEFVLMINKMGFPSRVAKRPEPFAF